MPRILFAVGTLSLALGLINGAEASLITSASAVLPPSKVVDFSQFGAFTFTAGPVQIGGLVGENITWSTTTAISVIGSGGYGLGSNGSWTSNKTYTGLNVDQGSMTYRFLSGAVSQVGGFMNYSINSDAPSDMFIQALGAGDAVLESYNITTLAPIVTPGGTDAGAFRGISRATADILAFRVLNKFAVLDDLTFSRGTSAAVPEPATLRLLGMGVLGTIGFAWRRRKAV